MRCATMCDDMQCDLLGFIVDCGSIANVLHSVDPMPIFDLLLISRTIAVL
jgi:hypothetical protein